ncbi:MAG: DUF1353 domain-containing protein [Halioglobus sp.]
MKGFSGDPKTIWLSESGDDRNMQIAEKFNFTDRRGKVWAASEGSIINGASIPGLWTLDGSPFIGDYRRASILHDIACQEARSRGLVRSADRISRACVVRGCSRRQSMLLYLGVRIGAWWRFKYFLKERIIEPTLIGTEPDKSLRTLTLLILLKKFCKLEKQMTLMSLKNSLIYLSCS